MSAPVLEQLRESLSDEDLIDAARQSFLTFFDLTFHVLHPGENLADAKYFDLLDHLLHSCEERRQRRFILNMPPGYMKSTLVSVYFTAWLLGRDPTVKIICASYGDDLAHLLSRRVRDLMTSPLYRRIFPGTILIKKSEDLLTTSKGASAIQRQFAVTSQAFAPTTSFLTIRFSLWTRTQRTQSRRF